MGSRNWQDVFWLCTFLLHLVIVGCALGIVGENRFRKKDRQDIDRHTHMFLVKQSAFTQDYWPLLAISGAISAFLGWVWLLLLASRFNQMIKLSVHVVTAYLTGLSVFCFSDKHVTLGIALAILAGLHFICIVSVIDRLPFTLLVLQRAVKMVLKLPDVIRVAIAFMIIMLSWLALWSFGASGVVASSIDDDGRWWLLVVFSASLLWTWTVLCNTLHSIASGKGYVVLTRGGRESATIPQNQLLRSLRYALTTSLGSICYGSLFTPAIRTLRWEIRGFRSKISNNPCLLCCVDLVFDIVESLVRLFNKYAYVQIAVHGKDFNHSARDAWELFQSTGVEALIAYDCSGAVLLISTVLGGLITGTCAVVLTRIKHPDGEMMMMGYAAVFMGMGMVGLAMVVVESAVTSIYICYAEDPMLIHTWDPELFTQMSEMLHRRLKRRSAQEREVVSQNPLADRIQEATAI